MWAELTHTGWVGSFDYLDGHPATLVAGDVVAAEVAAVEPGSAAVAAGSGYSGWRDTAAPTPRCEPVGCRRRYRQR